MTMAVTLDQKTIDAIARRVVEMLAPLILQQQQNQVQSHVRTYEPPADRINPYDMTEPELLAAERLLPKEEGEVLRLRVFAFRMARRGNHQQAEKLRRKATLAEQRYEAQRKAALCTTTSAT